MSLELSFLPMKVTLINKEITKNVIVSLTQGTPQSSNSQQNFHETPITDQFNSRAGGRGGFRGRGGFHGGRFKGSGGHFGNKGLIQCQIRYKTGHVASYFYYLHSLDPYANCGTPSPYVGYGNLQLNVWNHPSCRPLVP